MKISNIDTSYIERSISMIHGRKLVLWGAGWYVRSFIETYCGSGKLLQQPFAVCDSTRNIEEKEIMGVPVIPFSDLTSMLPDETAIVMTAGLLDLPAQVVPNELYYFPIYHRRSFEAYNFIKENSALCDDAINLLVNEKSQYIYKRRIENMLFGSFWDQSLYEGHAYFGNDLIGTIPNDGEFVFAGAFNGKHIVRALQNNLTASITAFEPSSLWHSRLIEKFKDNPKIKINNSILWDDFRLLPFEEDESNSGLTAHVSLDSTQQLNTVPTSTIDEIAKNVKISHIALDVEGSEQFAVRGAEETIKRDSPTMCLCLYHNFDDYFNLPHLVHKVGSGKYKLHVKQHSCISAIETVLYAV